MSLETTKPAPPPWSECNRRSLRTHFFSQYISNRRQLKKCSGQLPVLYSDPTATRPPKFIQTEQTRESSKSLDETELHATDLPPRIRISMDVLVLRANGASRPTLHRAGENLKRPKNLRAPWPVEDRMKPAGEKCPTGEEADGVGSTTRTQRPRNLSLPVVVRGYGEAELLFRVSPTG